MNNFEAMLTTIGVVIVGTLMLAIPILTACSFTLDWPDSSQFGLCILSFIEYIAILSMIFEKIKCGD